MFRRRIPKELLELRNDLERMLNPLSSASEVRTALACAAVPGSIMKEYPPRWHSQMPAEEVRTLIRAYYDDTISENDLTLAVFGRTYTDMALEVLDANRSSYFTVLPNVQERLRPAHVSPDWLRAVRQAPTGPGLPHMVDELLGELANAGPPTFMDLPLDGWDHSDPTRFEFRNAARVGYVAVAHPLGTLRTQFNADAESGLRGMTVTCDPRSPHPLDAIAEEVRDTVDDTVAEIAYGFERILGPRYFEFPEKPTYSRNKYKEALTEAAACGAMLAVVLADPEGCRFFTLAGEHVTAEALPWRVA
jgi:hypothetical protein